MMGALFQGWVPYLGIHDERQGHVDFPSPVRCHQCWYVGTDRAFASRASESGPSVWSWDLDSPHISWLTCIPFQGFEQVPQTRIITLLPIHCRSFWTDQGNRATIHHSQSHISVCFRSTLNRSDILASLKCWSIYFGDYRRWAQRCGQAACPDKIGRLWKCFETSQRSHRACSLWRLKNTANLNHLPHHVQWRVIDFDIIETWSSLCRQSNIPSERRL